MTSTEQCPKCGGLMGDGDRVFHGKCGRCVVMERQR